MVTSSDQENNNNNNNNQLTSNSKYAIFEILIERKIKYFFV